jgi:hypothetical protein
MSTFFNSLSGALSHHDCADCTNSTGPRLWRPVVFAPIPSGAGTAAPAGLSGSAIQSF